MILSPSLLSADYMNMERDINKVLKGGAQYLHIDIMDGHFVPNINFGPGFVSATRKITDAVLDVHLMITDPLKYAEDFLKAGADIVVVHTEVKPDIKALSDVVNRYGKKLGIAVNPPTDVKEIDPYLDFVDMALVMTVNPGFGGQKFIGECVDKIRYIRDKKPDLDVQVDGGISLDNLQIVLEAGANVIVAGNSIFSTDDPTKTAEEFLKRGNAF